ncbi:MAG: type II secretion system protein, partial [Lentisphaeraceae bacterium]|nr:type II secretion system protein [Lentisphaeraceae bacterium]
LIELLVVIAIIGVLATMLMPSIRKAKLSSENAVCLSNLKQQGNATQSYHVDHNGKLPYGQELVHRSAGGLAYRRLLSHYTHETPLIKIWSTNPSTWDRGYFEGLFRCPNAKEDVLVYAGSYGWNYENLGRDAGATSRVFYAKMDSPSTTLAAGDSPTSQETSSTKFWTLLHHNYPSSRHFGGRSANYVMLDGSCKPFTPQSLGNGGQFRRHWYQTK